MLKQSIQADTTEAMKNKDNFVVGVLRMLSAAVLLKEKDKRYKLKLEKDAELTDEEVIEVVTSEIKKRKDAIVLYKQGNRPELVEKEQKEMEVLKKYLPEQLSKEELEKLVRESIAKIKGEMKDPSTSSGQVMGKVMADLNPKIKGKADGGQVSRIVKELLIK
ncbi:MAG: hypothetical protein A2358_04160 [Candidatus Staskawiczbacteria bacterium RIFOXYB1_FULL_37_44]|uniref:Glutamyl-tRNA amidotransferase n=1 Tax=Candidatus Staskawiczbacteria bacterium RIFOXYB1_FULL_37_44 TaxID=1802223 RepID=A0A1G2IV92_9BACT|nr:MAG: hypothetical protein A2358_04160 [Candidatus Staskawiczbacteria bacterium RIFOXYB1_FULL_37_44]OGZ83002.1 MAG: hypothetical protein A2416_01910 [Candidatus Staskawiczbacteria bacterium RIFOXYC1_FULL_37_52]OGZ87372.1 MAG: hypothetical protein A2444_01360 [Candidatus Staskawiczbacteria bacterium RIFOXYC2_FULL_37_19]